MSGSLETTTRKLLRRYPQAFDTDRDGLITMMLQQFSNPYLAFREIIQNSVDEKATKIKVVTAQKTWKNRVYVSIEDNGRGMDLAGVRRYLTLFDSTKEDILETIGEMGVGKIFAFALNPDYLVIDTGKGKEGYRIVFNKDMSGKLSEISPRQGTKVTLVLPSEQTRPEHIIRKIRNSMIYSCSYVSAKIIIDGEKINRTFDINTENKIVVEEGSTRAVIGLTDQYHYKLFKGGISLEEGSILSYDDQAPFYGLEMLVDSYDFNQPISRNEVNRDERFRKVMQLLLEAKRVLIQKLADQFPTMDASSKETQRVKHYLCRIAKEDDYFAVSNLKIFSTVDGIPLSYDEILTGAMRERTLYYSRRQANSNELTYFTERGIAVLFTNPDFANTFGKRHNLGWQEVSDNVMIEGLTSDQRGYQPSFRERMFLNLLLYFTEFNLREKQDHLEGKIKTENADYNDSRISYNNMAFDWKDIKEYRFERFLDFKGDPREDLYFDRIKNTVIVNIHNPYVKAMLELQEVDSELSKYYFLCEVAASKAVFPHADHKTVEDFIISLGQVLLDNDGR